MMRTVGLLVAVGVLLSACSADNVSVADYAAAAEERATTYGIESTELKAKQLATLEDTVARLQNDLEGQALVDAAIFETARESTKLFAGISDALDRFVRDLDSMAAPASVRDLHLEYIQALETSRAGLASVLADLPGASSFEEIDRVIAGSGFADGQQRVEAACRALQAAIEAQGPVVDLRCDVTR